MEIQSKNVKSRSYREQLIDIDLQTLADAVENIAPNPSSYKVYTALLTQIGTDKPEANVLENTLRGDLVWSRNGDGQYTATLARAFLDENKFFTLNSITEYVGANVIIYWGNSNMFHLNTYTGNGQDMPYLETDGILYKYPIEIRVYNSEPISNKEEAIDEGVAVSNK